MPTFRHGKGVSVFIDQYDFSAYFKDLTNSNISLWYDDSGRPGFKFTNESKTKLIEQLQIAIEQRQITFPNIEVLIDELRSYEYLIIL